MRWPLIDNGKETTGFQLTEQCSRVDIAGSCVQCCGRRQGVELHVNSGNFSVPFRELSSCLTFTMYRKTRFSRQPMDPACPDQRAGAPSTRITDCQ